MKQLQYNYFVARLILYCINILHYLCNVVKEPHFTVIADDFFFLHPFRMMTPTIINNSPGSVPQLILICVHSLPRRKDF